MGLSVFPAGVSSHRKILVLMRSCEIISFIIMTFGVYSSTVIQLWSNRYTPAAALPPFILSQFIFTKHILNRHIHNAGLYSHCGWSWCCMVTHARHSNEWDAQLSAGLSPTLDLNGCDTHLEMQTNSLNTHCFISLHGWEDACRKPVALTVWVSDESLHDRATVCCLMLSIGGHCERGNKR